MREKPKILLLLEISNSFRPCLVESLRKHPSLIEEFAGCSMKSNRLACGHLHNANWPLLASIHYGLALCSCYRLPCSFNGYTGIHPASCCFRASLKNRCSSCTDQVSESQAYAKWSGEFGAEAWRAEAWHVWQIWPRGATQQQTNINQAPDREGEGRHTMAELRLICHLMINAVIAVSLGPN